MKLDDELSERFKVGRRRVLKSGGAALAIAAVGPVAMFSGRSVSAASTEFSQAYFDDRLGAYFQVDAGADGWSSLELVDVIGKEASPVVEQFSVRFRGPAQVAFDEGVYAVAPPDGEAFELHIQPRGTDADGAYYDATFALMKPLIPSCAGVA